MHQIIVSSAEQATQETTDQKYVRYADNVMVGEYVRVTNCPQSVFCVYARSLAVVAAKASYYRKFNTHSTVVVPHDSVLHCSNCVCHLTLTSTRTRTV
jgi:hypothetical protein